MFSNTLLLLLLRSIYRSKFTQSYYNDKHQDPAVVADRIEYIRTMDALMLRQPLWHQMPQAAYFALRKRERERERGREREREGEGERESENI